MDADAIQSVIRKIRAMTSRKEKVEWLIIAACATFSSILEVCAALSVACFVQVVNNPSRVFHYFHRWGYELSITTDQLMIVSCVLCAGVYLLKNAFSGWEVYYQSYSVQRMSYRFRAKLLHEYSNYCYQRYLAKGAVKHLQIFSSDIDQMFTNAVSPLASCLSELMVMIFLIGFLFYMNVKIALGVFVMTSIVVLLFFHFFMPLFYSLGSQLQEVGIERSKVLHHFFHGFKEVVIRGTNDAFIKEYGTHDGKHIHIVTRQNTFQAVPRLILECIFMLTFVGVVWGMVMMHQSADRIVAVLGGYLYIGFRLMPGVNRVINFVSQIKMAIPCVNRVHEQYTLLDENSPYEDIPEFQFNKTIEVHQVSFQYDKDKPLAVNQVSLSLNKGQSLGVIGETGSGKSTLIDLLLGINSPVQGKVLIDGQYPARCRQWHRRIGFVPQSVFLVDGSVEENIIFGTVLDDHDPEHLQNVIEQCDLKRMIERLPEGVATSVGDRGMFLSGGERQRIAIARALYPQPDVLVFDEATSSLDNETEKRVIRNIQKSSKDVTIIMVAHRLTTLINCDKVIKMHDGKLIAEGSYEDLCL